MQIQFEYGDQVVTGVLPSGLVNAFGKALIFNSPLPTETEEGVEQTSDTFSTVDAKIAQLLDVYTRCKARIDQVDERQDLLPIGFLINTETDSPQVLFLPPSLWGNSWPLKRLAGFYGDNTHDLCDSDGEVIDTEWSKPVDEAMAEFNARGVDAIDWIRVQARQEKDQIENAEVFKTTDLKSMGHRLLCERLEREGFMFSYEVHTIVPGDKRMYRRIDLVVWHQQSCVIVEIDGSQHGEYKQRHDDYDRDRRITKHWMNTTRFTHREVVNNLDGVLDDIRSRLGASAGRATNL